MEELKNWCNVYLVESRNPRKSEMKRRIGVFFSHFTQFQQQQRHRQQHRQVQLVFAAFSISSTLVGGSRKKENAKQKKASTVRVQEKPFEISQQFQRSKKSPKQTIEVQ